MLDSSYFTLRVRNSRQKPLDDAGSCRRFCGRRNANLLNVTNTMLYQSNTKIYPIWIECGRNNYDHCVYLVYWMGIRVFSSVFHDCRFGSSPVHFFIANWELWSSFIQRNSCHCCWNGFRLVQFGIYLVHVRGVGCHWLQLLSSAYEWIYIQIWIRSQRTRTSFGCVVLFFSLVRSPVQASFSPIPK